MLKMHHESSDRLAVQVGGYMMVAAATFANSCVHVSLLEVSLAPNVCKHATTVDDNDTGVGRKE